MIKAKRGFTLVELLVAIAIFAVLSALAGKYLIIWSRLKTVTSGMNSS